MPNDIANNMADTIKFLEEDNANMLTALTDLQLAYNKQMIELKEAKRLLRLAVEDFDDMHRHIWDCTDCESCPLNRGKLGICGQGWRYTDEAEKLLKEE